MKSCRHPSPADTRAINSAESYVIGLNVYNNIHACGVNYWILITMYYLMNSPYLQKQHATRSRSCMRLSQQVMFSPGIHPLNYLSP